ncbi:MAG TPA: twin transmembrane helix small protein [Burkholderiales bacterium]|nr:twin transmembrane helix small protein [Burkholderiales bacterium]
MKVVIIVAFIAILGALAFAGVAMIRGREQEGKPKPKTMARALAWRIGLSVALFLLILLAYRFGWIQPTGVPTGR